MLCERKNRGTGASLKSVCHAPVGVLKFSYENHVDISSVQQTLVLLGNFTTARIAEKERPDGKCYRPSLGSVEKIQVYSSKRRLSKARHGRYNARK